MKKDRLASSLTLKSPAHFREVRSRSLDLRLGEDYSTLLKFEYDAKLLAQRQVDPTQEEALISTAEKSSEPPAAPATLSTEERVDSEVQPNPPPPSPPRSPPSPTSPTSPPSPVSPASPASPASPTSPASPGCGFPPAPPESQPTAGKPGEQREVKEKKRDEKEKAPTTPSSTVMLMDAYPKTASNYAR